MLSRFRWVLLELDIFLPRSRRQGSRYRPLDFERKLSNLEHLRAPAVDRLSHAYDQIYTDALGEEDEVSRQYIVKSTLRSVLGAFRPFRADELASFISHSQFLHQRLATPSGGHEGTAAGEPVDTAPDIDPITEEDLLPYCANFITKTPNGLVRLAHLSVRQFLEERHPTEFSPPQQHLQIAMTCLGALSGLPEEHRLYREYIRQFWPIHVRVAADSEKLETLLETLPRHIFPPTPDGMDNLQLRVARKSSLQELDIFGNTSLHAAVLSDDIRMVELILNIDMLFQRDSPFIRSINQNGDTPLHLAAFHGFDDVFRLLVQARSHIKTQNKFGLSALHVATLHGHGNIIRTTWELGASLNVLDKTGGSPLQTAALCNDASITGVLLAAGFNAPQMNEERNTAMSIARERPSPNVLVVLTGTSVRWAEGDSRKSLQTEIPPMQSGSDETDKSMNRPRIRFKPGQLCSFCDMEGWVEGSRNALTYPHSPSLTALKTSAFKGCELCATILAAIRNLERANKETDYDLERHYDVKVRVSLAVDLNSPGSSQDMLSIFYRDQLAVQLELCIDHMGK